MLTHLLDPACRPFAVALALMAGIGLLEAITALFGAGLSSFLDGAIDQGLDLDAEPDLEGPEASGGASPGLLERFLGWLHVGEVPLLVLLVIFLASFGLSGLLLQSALLELFGQALPGWFAVPAVAALALPLVQLGGGALARWLPREETSAVTSGSLVGHLATVTLGTAAAGQPAQAKLHDAFGQVHYLLVEPDAAGETFPAGTQVLLVSRSGAVFRAVRSTVPPLTA
jgi:hypothetical protein